MIDTEARLKYLRLRVIGVACSALLFSSLTGCSSDDASPEIPSSSSIPSSSGAISSPETSSASVSMTPTTTKITSVSLRSDSPWSVRVAADLDKGPEVSKALDALKTDPVSVFSDAAKQQANGADLSQAVPRGSQVIVDESSWAPDGLGGGTIAVTITAPGGTASQYLAQMVREDGSWKVDATYPIESARVVTTS